jgi:predicted metal-binding protein
MKQNRHQTNYSIKNVIDSILEDNLKARKLTKTRKGLLYKNSLKALEKNPELKKLISLSRIKNYPYDGAKNFARIGILSPEMVIVDQRIKDMCMMPHWILRPDAGGKQTKTFGRCPGYGNLPGCPPNTTPVEEVEAKLKKADLFIVLQTHLISKSGDLAGWKFHVLNRLKRDIEKALGKGAVVEKYGSGPCVACKTISCMTGKPCKTPKLKTVALESMGICVDRLCNDLAELTGQNAWKIKWMKHFGFPQQKPKSWKYVEALAVKLP